MQKLRRLATRCLGIAAIAATSLAAAATLEPREIAARSKLALVTIIALDGSGQPMSQGSGFFLSADGILATNFHVVEGAAKLQVKIHTGEVYEHVLLRHADPRRDLAILRIPISGAPHLSLGDDQELVAGDRLYAMGNPVGLEATFSDGLLSARRLMDGTEMIQMTTPISHGSSGGPVMNSAGEVIGISSAGIEEGQNLNLTLPAHYIGPVLALGGEQVFPQGMPAGTTTSGAASSAANAAGGDDPHLAVVREQLDATTQVAASNGYQAGGESFGAVAQGAVESLDVQLDAAQDYLIVGACDNDCTDLDLALVDAAGTSIASDTATDDKPVLQFAGPGNGSYRLLVTMATCPAAPCRYGVRVFNKARAAAGGSGDDQYMAVVRAQLDASTQVATTSGYEAQGESFGAVAQGAVEPLDVQLDAAHDYLIVGACDNDCTDLDLALVDTAGNAIASDTATDDKPVLQFAGPGSGSYRLQVTMATCPAAPCRYGVRVFGKPRTQGGDDQHLAIVMRQLDRGSELTASAGYSSDGDHFGAVDRGTAQAVSLDLSAGNDYWIYGACDTDCKDLDLALMGPNGQTVARDTLEDDQPIIEVKGPASGNYRLVVTMADCTAAPCRYGVRVFSKSR
jgi:S1-C subfamily serine protease